MIVCCIRSVYAMMSTGGCALLAGGNFHIARDQNDTTLGRKTLSRYLYTELLLQSRIIDNATETLLPSPAVHGYNLLHETKRLHAMITLPPNPHSHCRSPSPWSHLHAMHHPVETLAPLRFQNMHGPSPRVVSA